MEPVRTLIDSGSTRSFIDAAMVKENKLPKEALETKRRVIGIDGKEIKAMISHYVQANTEGQDPQM